MTPRLLIDEQHSVYFYSPYEEGSQLNPESPSFLPTGKTKKSTMDGALSLFPGKGSSDEVRRRKEVLDTIGLFINSVNPP